MMVRLRFGKPGPCRDHVLLSSARAWGYLMGEFISCVHEPEIFIHFALFPRTTYDGPEIYAMHLLHSCYCHNLALECRLYL